IRPLRALISTRRFHSSKVGSSAGMRVPFRSTLLPRALPLFLVGRLAGRVDAPRRGARDGVLPGLLQLRRVGHPRGAARHLAARVLAGQDSLDGVLDRYRFVWFAVGWLRHAPPPSRLAGWEEEPANRGPGSTVVAEVGLEPTRPRGHQILSL